MGTHRSRPACLALTLVFGACAAAGSGKKASPTEWGFSLHAVPAFDVGTDGSDTVHPLVGYTRLGWPEGGGHDNVLQLGGQFRRSVAESPLWWGGEAAYARLTSASDADVDYPAYNGFNLGGLIGYELDVDFAPTSVFANFSFINFGGGAFEGLDFDGFNGWFFRLGVDVQPALFGN